MHLGATLRLLRVENGFGLRDLARRLGVSSAYLSRVENGLDPVPTADRLVAFARELSLSPRVLIDAAERLSPAAQKYVEQEPQAAALLRELSERQLSAVELAQVRRYVDTQFPRARPKREDDASSLARLLTPKRVVLQLGGAELRDVLEVACARLTKKAGTQLVTALHERCRALSPAVGAGVAVPHVSMPGVATEAVLVTLAQPVAHASTYVVLVSAERQHARIAHVARLAARGLSASVAQARSGAAAIERIAALEL